MINDQTKHVVLNVYGYFKKLQSKTKRSKGAFQKTVEATGVPKTTLIRIVEEKKDKCRSPSKKRYKVSRKVIVTDDFDKDAIRRKIYGLYEQKEHLTLSKLLVCCFFNHGIP